MTGPLKCGWGCGASFYSGEERQAHEHGCWKKKDEKPPADAQAPGSKAA